MLFAFLKRCRLVLALLLSIGAGSSFAACQQPVLTPPEALRISGSGALIVTHASALYDPRYAIKHGLDVAVKWAKEHRIPVVYLVDDSPIQYYEMEDCSPDYWVRSIDGEVPFDLRTSTVYFVGGHWELCLNRSANEVLFSQMRTRPPRVRYVFFMDAIYANGKSIQQEDPYYADFMSFMSVVNFGRPSGEAAPRVSLLEIMGSVKTLRHQYEYLGKTIPRWDRSVPDTYAVDLRIQDVYAVNLRKGRGLVSPKVEFLFVESADSLN